MNREWRVDEENGYAGLTTKFRDVEVSVDKESGDFEVRIEEGRGYSSNSCSCTIPFSVIESCLKFSGHVIVKK